MTQTKHSHYKRRDRQIERFWSKAKQNTLGQILNPLNQSQHIGQIIDEGNEMYKVQISPFLNSLREHQAT